jgi:undecaprenyl-diphosphatase
LCFRLDVAILTFVNQFVGRWPEFDRFIAYLSWQNTLKGGVLCTLLWWAWFSGRDRAREIVLGTISGSFAAIVTGRLLATALPLRVRPMGDPALNLRIPQGINAGQFIAWSFLPSDRTVLFIGLGGEDPTMPKERDELDAEPPARPRAPR